MAKKDVIEAEAVPVGDLSALSEADRWLAGQRAKVAEVAAQYRPGEVASAEEYRQAKRDRAALRRSIKEVEDGRKGMTKAVKEAVRGFEADVRELLVPLAEEDDLYRRGIEAWEEQEREAKYAEATEFYQDMAPDLVPLVPFDRLLTTWGLAEKWPLMSTSVETVKDQLAGHVEAIAKDEAAIDAMGLSDEDAQATKADYFSTLDLGEAVRRQQGRQAQRERVAELERERAEREGAAQAAQGAEDGHADATPEEAPTQPAPAPQIAPQGLVGQFADVAAQPSPAEGVPPIAFMAYVSEGQRAALVNFCRANGIHGSFRLTHGRRFSLVPNYD